MIRERYYATAVTMPTGTYIFGGEKSPTTSEFLRNGVWQDGPVIPNGFKQGCALKISPNEIILIGGHGTEDRVVKFDVKTNIFTSWSSLSQGRRQHSCVLLNNNIVIAGGIDHSGSSMVSTEIISLTNKVSRNGGNLNTYRHDFGLVAAGGHFKRVLAFGGGSSIEDWNEETEKWTMAPFSLQESRSMFGYIAVPPSVICPPEN